MCAALRTMLLIPIHVINIWWNHWWAQVNLFLMWNTAYMVLTIISHVSGGGTFLRVVQAVTPQLVAVYLRHRDGLPNSCHNLLEAI